MDEKEKATQTKQFNFKQWLAKCNLNAAENVFRENKMITMETLSMQNNNLSKLLSDKRICSNSKLVSKIIIALQTLEYNKNTQYSFFTSTNSKKNKNNSIPQIEQKLTDINTLENRLKNSESKYKKLKKSKTEYLKKSKTKYITDLNKSKNQITQTFSTIFQNLKQKEHCLLNELEKYNIHELNNDEKKTYDTGSENDTFTEKYKANQLIINDCKTYIQQQLNILTLFVENADNICNYSCTMKQIESNINNMYKSQMSRFAQNEQYMLEEINSVSANKYINSVSFKLNELIFNNMLEYIDKIGEILRYKKLEIDIKKVEWTDIAHINIYYEFINILTPSDQHKNINIQQYEIQYRYFDINMSETDDKFEWKSVLFPSRSISNNKMVANNPISIGIEAICNNKENKSDNETLFFIKMRIRHNPYYLWSNYSSTYKRRAANFLIIEKNETISLKLTQKKRKRGYRRKSYASGSLNSLNNHSLNNQQNSSCRRQSSVDLSDIADEDYYHQYYTFDNVLIHENGCLTINTHDPNEAYDDSLQNNTVNEKRKGYLHIVIHRDLIIYRGGKINVSGLGYSGGTRYSSGDSVNSFGELGETGKNKGGGGGSKTYELGCGGGGGYGSVGDAGCSGKGFGFSNNKTKYRQNIDGEGGCCYGDNNLSVCHFGSGGGGGDYGDSKGGNGGGIVIIECKGKIVMNENSEICANGDKGKYDSDGCGSGGSVYIKCGSLSMKCSGKIEAIGGKNNLRGNGGNGGYGRIRIKCGDKNVALNKYHIVPRPHVG